MLPHSSLRRTKKSGRAYRAIYMVVNWIGCNVGKAANADDVAARQRKLQ
ncbi:MAG: hypothetical protein V8Q84_03985 [Bilophila sp.]